jgi:hypothetical protein
MDQPEARPEYPKKRKGEPMMWIKGGSAPWEVKYWRRTLTYLVACGTCCPTSSTTLPSLHTFAATGACVCGCQAVELGAVAAAV